MSHVATIFYKDLNGSVCTSCFRPHERSGPTQAELYAAAVAAKKKK